MNPGKRLITRQAKGIHDLFMARSVCRTVWDRRGIFYFCQFKERRKCSAMAVIGCKQAGIAV